MDPGETSLFSLIAKRMSWLSQRQKVLAQNIANADTPGFAPRDLKPFAFRQILRGESAGPRAQVSRTDGAHMSGRNRRADAADEARARRTYETSLSGNSVVIEEQMMKVAETQAAYQLTTGLYRKHLAMIKSALGRPTQ